MLILDTNILRSQGRGLADRLRRLPSDGAIVATPALVVAELLLQYGDQGTKRAHVLPALEHVADGTVAVLPEGSVRLRECFGLKPGPFDPAHWRALADTAVRVDNWKKVRRDWDELHQDGLIDLARENVERVKAETRFTTDMLEASSFERDALAAALEAALDQHGVEASPKDTRKAQRELKVGITDMGIRRAWLLNQLAAAAGLPGVGERLRDPEGYETSLIKIYQRFTAPAYRGGLELAVQVLEVFWEALTQGSDHVEEADFIDLSLLMSVGDAADCVFVTEESKWLRMAERGDLTDRIMCLHDAVPGIPRYVPRSVDLSAIRMLLDRGR